MLYIGGLGGYRTCFFRHRRRRIQTFSFDREFKISNFLYNSVLRDPIVELCKTHE